MQRVGCKVWRLPLWPVATLAHSHSRSGGGGRRPESSSQGNGCLREALLLLQGVLGAFPLDGAQRHGHRGGGFLGNGSRSLSLGGAQRSEPQARQRRVLRPSLPQTQIPKQRFLPGLLGRRGSARGAGGKKTEEEILYAPSFQGLLAFLHSLYSADSILGR